MKIEGFEIILKKKFTNCFFCRMMNYILQAMNPINHNIFQEPGYHPQVEAISPTPDDRTAERDDVRSFFYDHDEDEDDHGDHI